MRVGIDARLWNESGVGRYTRNLVQELQKIDTKNDYVLFVRSVDYEGVKFQISNFKFQISKVDIRWHTLEEQLKFPKILESENLDLVHFPYFSVPIYYKKPFVVTIHDLILHHFPTGKATALPFPVYQAKLLGYKYIISQAAKKARKIITVSQATKQEIIDNLHVKPDKIVVTYEGAEIVQSSKFKVQNENAKLPTLPRLRGASKTTVQNSKVTSILDKKYFLYVGNAYPHKNLDRLMEAFKLLQKDKPDVSLVLVGKEDYFYKRLKDQYEKTSDQVCFLGKVNDSELATLYSHTQALVCPSLMEGFGLPALEAMANGCLVLCSGIPVFKEICEDAAIYFDPKNIVELSATMRSVLENKTLYKQQIKKGEKRATKFSWQKTARETLEIYESCLSIRQG